MKSVWNLQEEQPNLPGPLLTALNQTNDFIQNANNRVILATDGDFNVGTSSTAELIRLIEKKRQLGIYLTILGLGMGNYKDDTKDAGELGAGHSVTALYEIIPAGSKDHASSAVPLKYQTTQATQNADQSNEIMTVKLRYKAIGQTISRLVERTVSDKQTAFSKTTENFRFSAAVAGIGMLLRQSKFKKEMTYQDISDWAKTSKGTDETGDRAEFIRLVKTAELLTK